MAAWTFREKKNNNKVESFLTLFLMFTIMWITEKELERVIAWKQRRQWITCLQKSIKIDDLRKSMLTLVN